MNLEKEFNSPYNFVPMAKNVHIPEWQNISQDIPEEDGLSGTLEYTLQNHSPLLVGDERKSDEEGNIVNFFQTPDNQYAIPGTSLKGMIRNWLEIATHSKMSIINDLWLSYRDLKNDDYKRLFKSGSKAGWLRFEEGQWQLYPAEYSKIANTEIKVNVKKTDPTVIYNELKGIKKHHDGFLIVTGHVYNKKHNFIFKEPQAKPLPMADKNVIKGFLDINKEANVFKYLDNLKHEHGIPVFYISVNNQASQIGMSQMFRFPYKHSVGELRHDSHTDESTTKDFVELLFGNISDDNPKKSRISFSLATCHQEKVKPLILSPTVLGTPNSSFYPAYIDQKNTKEKYNTYNQKEAKIAGFKRYAVHKNINIKLLEKNGNVNYKITTQLRPLPEKTIFTGKIRFHNLKPQELGAIIYALQTTQKEGVFHQLGMAKPYGLGKVSFDKMMLKLNVKEDESSLVESFHKYLKEKIGSNETLEKLLTMQNENSFLKNEIEYLKFGTQGQEFTDVKDTKNGIQRLINLNDATNRLKKSQIKQKRAESKKKIIEEATEEEMPFAKIKQSLQQVSQEEISKTLIANIAKQLTELHQKFSCNQAEITSHQKDLLKNYILLAEKLNKPKINSAIKKIKRDILQD